jgi:hypothetical protein
VLLLSLILQGVAAIKARLLPPWSTVPLILAPFLAYPVLSLGPRLVLAGPVRGSGAAIYIAIAWLLLGCGLLLSRPDTGQSRPSAPGHEPSAPA